MSEVAGSHSLRVVHLISTLEPGGAQTMLSKLVAASAKSLRHHVVSMIDGGSVASAIRSYGVRVESLGMARGRLGLSGIYRFAQVLRRVRPDIVQTWMYHADLLGLVAKPITRTPVIWNIRSARHLGLDSSVTRACAFLSNVPDAVVVNSEAGLQVHIERGYRPRRWALIGNGFDTTVFRPSEEDRRSLRAELGLPSNTLLVGLVARFDPHKGHDLFLAAAGALARRRTDVRFILAGSGTSGDNAALMSLCSANGLEGRIHMLGERLDVPHLTAALDVASLTSIGEAFPNVVGEAMASGVPCIVTDVGDAARIVGNPSLVVPSGDSAALAACFERLLTMTTDERQTLGARGRNRVMQHFSMDIVAQKYVALYRDVAGMN